MKMHVAEYALGLSNFWIHTIGERCGVFNRRE